MFKKILANMVDSYGVNNYMMNEDDEDLWFECPECGEPILECDWGFDDIYDVESDTFYCPICGEVWDI